MEAIAKCAGMEVAAETNASFDGAREIEAYRGELKDLRSDRTQRHALQDRLRYLDHELHRAHETYRKMLDAREAGAYCERDAIEKLRQEVTNVTAQLLAHTGA